MKIIYTYLIRTKQNIENVPNFRLRVGLLSHLRPAAAAVRQVPAVPLALSPLQQTDVRQ